MQSVLVIIIVECFNGIFVFKSLNSICVAISISGPFSLSFRLIRALMCDYGMYPFTSWC